ncbi:GntR family transcriptional regulator [Affinibrenneria salicis]|uniref:GntR family transcriptional regulator n=1 Tax=Affinibrenneria salicis TaxID=2590031 RepID=A0A5J5FYC1_9GAMM|nr:GntR family transcriptional regulator [Affinibrenneria salicis]KAA8998887.1 GntR family transcriptional regulator [Affinibrenneria salicis]
MPGPYVLTANEPVNQQIYRFLRQEIVTCTLHPGALLSEKEISSRFNVSRQPVREAFIKLAEASLVQILPQRGTFVMKISPKRVADGRFIREVIETAVARRAAQEITPQFVMLMENNLQLQQMASRHQDSNEFLKLDDEFHLLMARSIDCALAWETVENIKAAMDRVRYLTLSKVSPPDLLIEQHYSIFNALKSRDPAAAESAVRRHLQEMIYSITPIVAQNSDWFDIDPATPG